MSQIIALLTCHNRRKLTIACLEGLAVAYKQAGLDFHAVLVDDGSTDQTTEAVGELPYDVRIISGSGSLFWNRGMHLAWSTAILMFPKADGFFLVNDDITIYPESIGTMISLLEKVNIEKKNGLCGDVIVGSMCWPESSATAYGGVVRTSKFAPTRFDIVPACEVPRKVDTFNANLVLISRRVIDRIGLIDPVFEHGMGDFDYGLRASAAGFNVILAPDFQGECPRNPTAGSFRDGDVGRFQRLKSMLGRRGLPPRSWMHFTRRHAGWCWPLFWVWPYVRTFIFRPSR